MRAATDDNSPRYFLGVDSIVVRHADQPVFGASQPGPRCAGCELRHAARRKARNFGQRARRDGCGDQRAPHLRPPRRRSALLAGRKLSQKSLVPPKAFPLPQSYTKAGNAQ